MQLFFFASQTLAMATHCWILCLPSCILHNDSQKKTLEKEWNLEGKKWFVLFYSKLRYKQEIKKDFDYFFSVFIISQCYHVSIITSRDLSTLFPNLRIVFPMLVSFFCCWFYFLLWVFLQMVFQNKKFRDVVITCVAAPPNK